MNNFKFKNRRKKENFKSSTYSLVDLKKIVGTVWTKATVHLKFVFKLTICHNHDYII